MGSAIWIRDNEVISSFGDQSGWYLNGQLSVNVDSLRIGEAKRALLLEPDGSLVVPVGVVRAGEHKFTLFVPVGTSSEVLARLERFQLRTKVTFARSSGSVVWFSNDSESDLGTLSQLLKVHVPELAFADSTILGGISSSECYTGLGSAEIGDLLSDLDFIDRTMISRILAGEALWGAEISPGMNPTELGESFTRARADFNKGCYTGQELIERVDSRGYKTPRRLSNFLIYGFGSDPGGLVNRVFEEDRKPVFTVTSAEAYSPGKSVIALGFAHRIGGEFRSQHIGEDSIVHAVGLGEISRVLAHGES